MKKQPIFFIFLILITLVAEEYTNFPIFVHSGSILQYSLNGGGSTIPDKASGAILNPASLYAYHKQLGKRVGINGNYHNDLDGEILTGGGGSFAINSVQVIGIDYQLYNYREGDSPIIHRGVFSFSSLGHEESENNAEFLSWGINLNYLNNTGTYGASDSLPVNSSVNEMFTATNYPTGVESVDGFSQAVSLDIGFFNLSPPKPFWSAMGWQPLFSQHYTYSLVFENILGYRWDERNNGIETASRNIDDTTRVDSLYYSGNSVKTDEWLQGRYKSLLFGVAFHRQIAGDKVILSIPVDVRFWGFMDKTLRDNSEWKNRNMLRVGMNANISNRLRLRCGYSWAPLEFQTLEDGELLFDNQHQISGGVSLTIGPVDLDAGFKKGEFAFGSSIYF